jgi:Sec-independent protein translocase protein TatA
VNFFGIGGFELIVIAGLAFFLLGPKKMIETSREAGKIFRELKVERDKFTKMVMEEYEDDDTSDTPDDSKSGRATAGASDAGPHATPAGAVSRPRGRMQTVTDQDDETDEEGPGVSPNASGDGENSSASPGGSA